MGELGRVGRVSERGLRVVPRLGKQPRAGVGFEEFAEPGFKLFSRKGPAGLQTEGVASPGAAASARRGQLGPGVCAPSVPCGGALPPERFRRG